MVCSRCVSSLASTARSVGVSRTARIAREELLDVEAELLHRLALKRWDGGGVVIQAGHIQQHEAEILERELGVLGAIHLPPSRPAPRGARIS